MLQSALVKGKKSLKRAVKKFKTFYKRKPKLFLGIVLGLAVLMLSLGTYLLLKPKPNDDIFFLDSKSTAILGNKNPSFNVGFGKRDNPQTQWVRFEARASTKNPFEEKNEKFFTKLINFLRPKKEYGIEMSLQGVKLSETEQLDLGDSEEVVKTVADIIGTDEVKTTTELVDSGRVIGEYTKSDVSKKTVLNKNVADGVDIEYQILEGLGLKEEIVIRDLEEYTKDCEGDLKGCKLPLNEFVFDLKLDDGLELRRGWFTYNGKSTESYYFVDKYDNYVGHFLPSWAIDGKGNKTYDVMLEVDKEVDSYRAKVMVDINWLFSPDRVYPVRIDPSIIHDSKNKFDEGIFDRTESVEGPKVQLKQPTGYNIDANTVGYWKLGEEEDVSFSYYDYDTFDEPYPGGNDVWSERNSVTPVISSDTAYSGENSLYMPSGWGRNFEGTTGLETGQTSGGYNTNTYPYMCMAYKIPAGTDVNMLIYITEVAAWRSITVTQPDSQITTYPKVASWQAVVADNTWRHKCIDLDTQLDVSLGTGNHTITAVIWHTGGGTYNTGPFYIDDFLISNYPVKSTPDSSGNGNHGYLVGARNYVKAIGEQGLSFDGVSEYVHVNKTASDLGIGGASSKTIEAWVNTKSFNGGGIFQLGSYVAGEDFSLRTLAVQDSWRTQLYGTADMDFFFDAQNKWVHFALVYDGNTAFVYANGKPLVSKNVVLNTTDANTFKIGRWNNIYFDGLIDEVRISNVARTPDEIMRSYLNGVGKYSGEYISPVIDFDSPSTVYGIDWVSNGVHTNGGEIPYSTTGLIAQWDFNEVKGTVASSKGDCGTSCNGTLTNFSNTSGQDEALGSGWTYKNRKWGSGALMFDGTNDYVNTNTVFQPEGSFTINTWFNTSAPASGTQNIIGNNRYGAAEEANRGIELGPYGTWDTFRCAVNRFDGGGWINADFSGRQNDGKWHYVSLVFTSGESLKCFLDGVLMSETDTSVMQINKAESKLYIGSQGEANGGYFNGVVDTVSIYDRALSKAEILSNYQAGNIEFQYRNSEDGTTWNDWIGGSEEKIDDFEDVTDWLDGSTNSDILKPSSSDYVIQGEGSLKVSTSSSKIDSNTVGYWKLDETNGSGAYIKDYSGNDNHGTPTGTTYVKDGKVGGARSFNGSSDGVLIDSSITTQTTNWSIEGWIKPSSLNQLSIAVYNGNDSGGYGFGLGNGSGSTGGVLQVLFGGVAWFNCGYTFPSTNSWYHIVITRDTTTTRCYVDGAQTTNTSTSTPSSVQPKFTIGHHLNSSNSPYRYFSGQVDNVKISNTVYSSFEISESYRMGKDHYVNKTLEETFDLTDKSKIPFWVASDMLGDNIELTYGNSAYANYLPDDNTVGLWKLDDHYQSASGGTITQSGGYTYHTFTSSDTFITDRSMAVDVLVVGGGGGAGKGTTTTTQNAGGGGAGGLILRPGFITNSGPTTVTIGGGGAGSTSTSSKGSNGSSSVFGTLTALGGGGGGSTGTRNGNSLGSGGGASRLDSSYGTGGTGTQPSQAGDSGTFGYGRNGATSTSSGAGGGGGAGGAGTVPGAGAGMSVWGTTYATGGAAHSNNASGAANTGNGGRAAATNSANNGGSGGSGVVIVRYPTPTSQVRDLSGNNNHGTPWGTTYTEGVIGGGRSFNGSRDYIASETLSGIGSGNAIHTIDAWIKPTAIPATRQWPLLLGGASAGNHHWLLNTNGTLSLGVWSGGQCNITPDYGTWNHVVVSFDGTTIRCYKNGVLASSNAATFNLSSLTLKLGQAQASEAFFNGQIDEVRISSIVRTPEEIREAYEIGKRRYKVNIEFKADLQSSNLISDEDDKSFTISETNYGTNNEIENLNKGDKIIVKENYNGTEYVAQGSVNTINVDTGAVTVSVWDSGSTFPSVGYTVNATVFKWQREYFDVRDVLPEHKDKVSVLSFRVTNQVGANFWIDDIKASKNITELQSGIREEKVLGFNDISKTKVPGTRDFEFASGNGLAGASGVVYTVVEQTDGKILLGGEFVHYGGREVGRIVRLNIDGTVDRTFDTGTGASSVVRTIAIQDDGKILVGGDFISFNGSSHTNIVRLNSDGSIDSSFSVNKTSNRIYTIALQSDGKILAGGWSAYYGTSLMRVARLNTDGSLDSGFDPGTGPDNTVLSITPTSGGKILIAGIFSDYNSTTVGRIVRVNSDGSVDSSFNAGTGANATIYAMALQSDGKILVGGDFTSFNSNNINRIARLLSDGTFDSSFDPGTGSTGSVINIIVQGDGKIQIGGYFFNFNGTSTPYLARLSSTGDLDSSFSSGFTAESGNYVWGLSILGDGKVLAGGNFQTYNSVSASNLVKINSDGSLDTNFNTSMDDSGINPWIFVPGLSLVYDMVVQNDRKIIVVGSFWGYGGVEQNCIVRLNEDGTMDGSFDAGTGATGGDYEVYAIDIQSDGKILIGGHFSYYNDIEVGRFARINTDGSLDNTFNMGSGFSGGIVYAIKVLENGKILVGGDFNSYNGTIVGRLVRLNTDGSLDSTFNEGGEGVGGRDWQGVVDIEELRDGSILIGGDFFGYNGTTIYSFAKLTIDGALDTSFNSGGLGFEQYTTIQSIKALSNGKILLGGHFWIYNGEERHGIIRLNSDGTLDKTFNSGIGTGTGGWSSSAVFSILPTDDGRILLGGTFISYQGNKVSRIVSVNDDGSLDSSFISGYGIDVGNSLYWGSGVMVMKTYGDDKVIIGGKFFSYNGVGTNSMVMINYDIEGDNILKKEGDTSQFFTGNTLSSTTTLKARDMSLFNRLPFFVASSSLGKNNALIIGSNRYVNYEIDENTVGFWRMEEGGIAVRDGSMSYNDGQFTYSQGGGSVVNEGDGYISHIFTSNGTFTPPKSMNVEVLVVGGGGGGGSRQGGGGGGGGVIHSQNYSVTKGSGISVTIGGGGTGSDSDSVRGTNGGNTIFGTLTALGGGGGGSRSVASGNSGGSGGGGASLLGAGGVGTSGPPRQGYDGGTGSDGGYVGGGGGGASEVGMNGGPENSGGKGGDGYLFSNGRWYGGGGGGGSWNFVNTNSGGLGGGGRGGRGASSATGENGTVNTGGGGGGSRGTGDKAGDGGSGIVIVRYEANDILDGKVGKARVFDDGIGVNLVVKNDSSLDISKEYTLESWIYPQGSSVAQGVISKRINGTGGYQMILNESTSGSNNMIPRCLASSNNNAYRDASIEIPLNRWSHVACVYQGVTGTLDVYINGVLSNGSLTGTVPVLALPNSSDLYIGSLDSSSGFFNGYLDEVRISDIARDSSDIEEVYNIDQRMERIDFSFRADLQPLGLIEDEADTIFNISEIPYGQVRKIKNLEVGDTIIIKEGEYRAQGTVTIASESTGYVQVSGWDAGSTFPPYGYTTMATVFKWQQQYLSLVNTETRYKNNISTITIRKVGGTEDLMWLDDITLSGDFGTLHSTRYFQYKAIFTTTNSDVTPWLSSVSLDFIPVSSDTPSMEQIMRHGKWFGTGGQKRNFWWAR